uniref:Uncharacterized protein n=1 Tax=Timema poppense TaxID=170557 RepID=A0A7R9H2D5_TIMPO|nr:unnamed protein product [Timema poppensis]
METITRKLKVVVYGKRERVLPLLNTPETNAVPTYVKAGTVFVKAVLSSFFFGNIDRAIVSSPDWKEFHSSPKESRDCPAVPAQPISRKQSPCGEQETGGDTSRHVDERLQLQ